MSTKPTEPKSDGRFATVLSLLKRMFAESPILATVTLTTLVPIGGLVVNSAITLKWDSIPPLILIEAAIVIFVCIPLIITQAWKNNQKIIGDVRIKAIEAEGERRMAEEERKIAADRESQGLVRVAMEAKLESLKATTDFLLNQSDRHERTLLKEVGKNIAENLKEAANFVDQEDFTGAFLPVLQEIEKVHQEYDTLAENLQMVVDNLRARTSAPTQEDKELGQRYDNLWKTHQGNIDKIQELNENLENFKANYQAQETTLQDANRRLDQKTTDVEELLGEIEGGAQNYQILQTEHDKLKAQLDPRPDEKPKLDIVTHSTESSSISPPDKPTSNALEEALKVVDNLEDSAPEVAPKNYWTCLNCNRDNTLRQIRCPKCNHPKQLEP